jgi:site-specific recombinase XerD
MSIELLHDLDLYLRSRGYPKEGALFIGHKGNRLAPEDMSIILKDKAKLVLGELGKKFHLSLLRKSFQNALDNTPAVSRAFTESMMGHSKGITDAYSQPSSAEIKTAYDLIHPRLSINGYVQARTDLKDIGQKLEKQNDTISILARAMARSIAEQKKIEGLSLMTHEETMDFLRTWTTTEQIGLGKKKKEVGEE